jgi:hypothetical protein
VLKLSEDEAKKEIREWLKRHYMDQCHDYNGLIPFEGAHKNIVKTPYGQCEAETTQNCLNGFTNGKPFMRKMVEIFFDKAVDYIRSLGYPRRKETALLALLDFSLEHNSIDVNIGYLKLMELFHTNSKSTVSSWLDKFQEDAIFIRIKRGYFNTETGKGKTSKYRLVLQDDCYRVAEYGEILTSPSEN